MHASSGPSPKDLSGLVGPARSIRLLPESLPGSVEHASHPAAARRMRQGWDSCDTNGKSVSTADHPEQYSNARLND